MIRPRPATPSAPQLLIQEQGLLRRRQGSAAAPGDGLRVALPGPGRRVGFADDGAPVTGYEVEEVGDGYLRLVRKVYDGADESEELDGASPSAPRPGTPVRQSLAFSFSASMASSMPRPSRLCSWTTRVTATPEERISPTGFTAPSSCRRVARVEIFSEKTRVTPQLPGGRGGRNRGGRARSLCRRRPPPVKRECPHPTTGRPRPTPGNGRVSVDDAETTGSTAGPEVGGELMTVVEAAAVCSARRTILTSRAPV